MTIGVIARTFNGMSILPSGMFIKNIECMLPHVDKFTIIEGASYPPAKPFTNDGHSTDDTVMVIKKLIEEHGPKIELIQSPSGWWEYGTGEYYKAINKKMTTDYVWILDNDEFYHELHIPRILDLLEKRQPYMVEFYAKQFWGNWNTHVSKESEGQWGNELGWQRIFRNKPGVSYWVEHHPPTLIYEYERVCNNQSNVLTRKEMREIGIELYHYGFVCRSQVEFKHKFYGKSGWDYTGMWDKWQKDHSTLLPYGAETEEFDPAGHPAAIHDLMERK